MVVEKSDVEFMMKVNSKEKTWTQNKSPLIRNKETDKVNPCLCQSIERGWKLWRCIEELTICPSAAFLLKSNMLALRLLFNWIQYTSNYKLISAYDGEDQLCHRHGSEWCWGFQSRTNICWKDSSFKRSVKDSLP